MSDGTLEKLTRVHGEAHVDEQLPPWGNPRTMEERIAVCRPLLPCAEKLAPYLSMIDASRRYANHGALVLRLQERLRADFSLPVEVVVASSGTAALAGGILAVAGRAPEQRPLCLLPAYTFVGTLSAVELCGFTPYLVDVDPATWMLDPEYCSSHSMIREVGLVVPVAPYGRPVEQRAWNEFRDRTGIPVVIDGAAAFEAIVTEPDLYAGDIPVAVSFHATKIFGTGEGGAVFCSDRDISTAALQCLNFGYGADRISHRPSLNGKMSEYHAAIGLAELDGWTDKLSGYRRVVYEYLKSWQNYQMLNSLHTTPSIASNYMIFEAADEFQSLSVQAGLRSRGIGHRMWYGPGLHRQPYCSSFGRDDLRETESLADRLIGLPMSADMTADDVASVAQTVFQSHRGALL